MLTIGWFSTGRGEGSLGLLRFVQERILQGEVDARLQFVFSNREPGEGEGSDTFFRQVDTYGIPLVNFSSRKFRKKMGGTFADHRIDYDREAMARLKRFSPDVCVLAGYMLITGADMCRHYTMLNLHPALPTGPIGTWQQVIWDLIESRADRTGAMVHLATEDLDAGPVITYFTLPIVGDPFDDLWREIEEKPLSDLKEAHGEKLPLFRLIREGVAKREPYLVVATLKSLEKGTVRIRDREVVGPDDRPLKGLCLDKEMEEALASG